MKFDFNSKTIFSRLMKYNTLLILISLLVLSGIFGYLINKYFSGFRELDATANGRSIAQMVSENINDYRFKKTNLEENKREIIKMTNDSNYEISIIDKSGNYIIKTFNNNKNKEFYFPLETLETQKILDGNKITKKIIGENTNYLMMAFPLVNDSQGKVKILNNYSSQNNIIGAVILQTPLENMTGTISKILKVVFISGLIAMTLAFIINIPLTRHITRPLLEIKNAAIEISDGNYRRVNTPKNATEEIKKMIETFNYAVSQIESNFEKKRRLEKMRKEFMANISHEFRAPLTSIKGFLELFMENNLNDEEIKKYAEIMHDDTEYLEYLVHDLLILGKLDSENVELNREKISLIDIIDRTINSLKTKFNQKNITIKKEYEKNLSPVSVDKMRIHQVLINILENAIKFTPKNSTITIEVREKDQKIKVDINDEGPGIPEEKLEKIWERFYKIDEARTRNVNKGSGLGLSIVKNIINQHGGQVKATNTDKGAKFSFYLNTAEEKEESTNDE